MMKKLGFGMMRLPLLDGNDPTSFDEAQVFEMVDRFLQEGFVYFDTAYMYHNHSSEAMVRRALVERHPRNTFLLATKLPTMYLKEVADMERIFKEQLQKCGVSYFDYYLLHCLNTENYATAQRLDAFGFVAEKKAAGLVRKIGFSYHDDAALLDRILTEHPEMEFVQLQINYLDWDSESVQSRKCYEVARRHGKEILVMEPVKGGSLAAVPPAAELLFHRHSPERSAASWAIRFAASLEGVSMVLSGMSNLSQLEDNLSYMSEFSPLSPQETQTVFRVRDIINSRIAIACTDCRYCVEGCPQNIPIPDYFHLYNLCQQETEDSKTAHTTDYDRLTSQYGKASDCIGCGQCTKQCPQHLEIPALLADVAKHFESGTSS